MDRQNSLPARNGQHRAPSRWPAVLLGLVAGAGGVVAIQQVTDRDASTVGSEEIVSLLTVEVETADLLEEIEWSGTLDFSDRISVSRSSGTVTGTVEVGTELDRGDTVVEIDGEPVVLFFGETPFFRTLEDDVEGPDVFELETNLVALGYDPDGTVTVDEEFTAYTELMVERWQEDIGVDVTGIVDVDDVVLAPSPVVILSGPDVGDLASGVLLELAPPSDLVVTVPVAVTDAAEWEVGDVAVVELADETTHDARVVEVGTEITTDADGSTLDVSLELTGDTSGLLDGAVTVRTIGEAVRGATVVPTRALVALAEGGFAVEVDDGSGSAQLIAIEIGSFDDGLVEVVSGAIAPGDLVVVPQ